MMAARAVAKCARKRSIDPQVRLGIEAGLLPDSHVHSTDLRSGILQGADRKHSSRLTNSTDLGNLRRLRRLRRMQPPFVWRAAYNARSWRLSTRSSPDLRLNEERRAWWLKSSSTDRNTAAHHSARQPISQNAVSRRTAVSKCRCNSGNRASAPDRVPIRCNAFCALAAARW